MKHTSIRSAVVAATALTALAATMAPAHAEGTVVNDGADATASLSDIRKVRIDHGADELTIRINVPDLRKEAQASITVYLDKTAKRRGPEFGLGLPLFSGSDYQMFRMRKWQSTGEPLACSYDLDLKWKRDVAIVTVDRGCTGDADRLKVGMRMTDLADDDHVVTDWMIGRREFTGWLTAG
jgi:hypothetical protein